MTTVQQRDRAVINDVRLLGMVSSTGQLRLDQRPFRLLFELTVPRPLWLPGAFGGLQTDVLTVEKEGANAVEVRQFIGEGVEVLVIGSLCSRRLSDSERPMIWVKALSVRGGISVQLEEGGLRRLNQICVWGAVAKEPQLRITAAGKPWMSFLMAVDMPAWVGAKRANFMKVSAWGDVVYEVAPRLLRGRPVLVHGALRSRMVGGYNDVQIYAAEIQ